MSTSPAHTAKCAFFSCIDDRLTQANAKFIASHGSAFHPALAGGGAAFLDPESRGVALKQILAAYLINHITEVYLQSHTDCGAYRLAGVTFESDNAELERLYTDLDDAAGYIGAALTEAGAKAGEVTIHALVVSPSGELMQRPEMAARP